MWPRVGWRHIDPETKSRRGEERESEQVGETGETEDTSGGDWRERGSCTRTRRIDRREKWMRLDK